MTLSNLLLPNHGASCILITRTDSAELRQQQDTYKQWLDADEIHRLNQMRLAQDKLRFITGRAIIKSIIADILAIAPQDVSLHIDRFGKPLLNANSDLSFNISHSGDYIVAIFTKGYPSGIDVQSTELDEGLDDIMKQSFSTQECQQLKTHSALSYERFYTSWTIKEAFAKAHGIGMHIDFKKLQILYTTAPETSGVQTFNLAIPFPFISSQCQWMIRSVELLDAIMSIAINHRDQNPPELNFYHYIPNISLDKAQLDTFGAGQSIMS